MSIKAENHILDQIFEAYKTPVLSSVSNNINSNEKALNEIRMCDIWQIVPVDV